MEKFRTIMHKSGKVYYCENGIGYIFCHGKRQTEFVEGRLYMEDDILYNFFITDYKLIDRSNITGCNNSIERMLKRYSLRIGDYENNVLTEALFIRLGWSNRFKDTLLSFRSILYSSIECFSNPQDDINYRVFLINVCSITN